MLRSSTNYSISVLLLEPCVFERIYRCAGACACELPVRGLHPGDLCGRCLRPEPYLGVKFSGLPHSSSKIFFFFRSHYGSDKKTIVNARNESENFVFSFFSTNRSVLIFRYNGFSYETHRDFHGQNNFDFHDRRVKRTLLRIFVFRTQFIHFAFKFLITVHHYPEMRSVATIIRLLESVSHLTTKYLYSARSSVQQYAKFQLVNAQWYTKIVANRM